MYLINEILESISHSLGFNALEKYGLYSFLLGLILIVFLPNPATIILVCTSIFFGIAGIVALFTEGDGEHPNYSVPKKQADEIQTTISAPITDEQTIAEKIKAIHLKNDFKCPSCGAIVLPTYVKCKHCGSVLVDISNLPRPGKWGDVEIGQSVNIKHHHQGNVNLSVTYRIWYGELWQAQMKPNVPWTLTGNYYVGLGLEKETFLLNWQNRFYLLDSQSSLTDINRDFSQAARSFAASNQTREVTFLYDKTVWKIDDIGRFRIEFTEGDGIILSPGAVGRFIHARRDNKILVIEDYQSGGVGLDTLWMGYQIEEENIMF
jgi:hypothetical protein